MMLCRLLILLIASGLFSLAAADDTPLDFSNVSITLGVDASIYVDADIDYQLNDTAMEALENGVPLTFELHVQMRRADAWIWEADVVNARLRSVLGYRSLSGLYEVHDLGSEEKQVFATRSAALTALGAIRDLVLIQRDQLDLKKEYKVRLQVKLDIEALPLPMRPLAYLSGDWDIESEPWEWQLKP